MLIKYGIQYVHVCVECVRRRGQKIFKLKKIKISKDSSQKGSGRMTSYQRLISKIITRLNTHLHTQSLTMVKNSCVLLLRTYFHWS